MYSPLHPFSTTPVLTHLSVLDSKCGIQQGFCACGFRGGWISVWWWGSKGGWRVVEAPRGMETRMGKWCADWPDHLKNHHSLLSRSPSRIHRLPLFLSLSPSLPIWYFLSSTNGDKWEVFSLAPFLALYHSIRTAAGGGIQPPMPPRQLCHTGIAVATIARVTESSDYYLICRHGIHAPYVSHHVYQDLGTVLTFEELCAKYILRFTGLFSFLPKRWVLKKLCTWGGGGEGQVCINWKWGLKYFSWMRPGRVGFCRHVFLCFVFEFVYCIRVKFYFCNNVELKFIHTLSDAVIDNFGHLSSKIKWPKYTLNDP